MEWEWPQPDLDFTCWGVPTLQQAPTYRFSENLQEMENILGRGGGRGEVTTYTGDRPLDLPILPFIIDCKILNDTFDFNDKNTIRNVRFVINLRHTCISKTDIQGFRK